ncbi:hypothetical protein GIB67_004396 [Kingdonia uniflora]|uniref:Uncharacterized protein n=1 Tax=Kingdonia uniflora TaxID=39325 RepID=A0A7J7MRY4_9MAGN|nr:hypothetical protein GIB67_004396 [Kingdonia uniflora]
MGFAEKIQVDGGIELEGKKWVIAGIPTRGPLRQIKTKNIEKENCGGEEQERSITPTCKEARIPERLPCPPAPKKRRPSLRCKLGGAREFFNPPDLESVFIRHIDCGEC